MDKRIKNVYAFARRTVQSSMAKNISRSIPALTGLALLSFGVSLVYLPAGIIVGGLSLLLIDSRT